MRRDVFVAVFLVLVTVGAYAPVVRNDFVTLDDPEYVFENSQVRRGLTWQGVGWAFTTYRASNWHPLTWLSHMLDCELFGLNAGYHHLVNVLLHVLNSLLLYLVLSRMTGTVFRSAMVAALFALHPLHVESVAWMSERKDVLSTFFFMLALWAYVRYAASPCWSRYGLVFACLALGLMAKPMLVTVPFLLILLDYWPLGRFRSAKTMEPVGGKKTGRKREHDRGPGWVRLIVEKVPLIGLVAAFSVVTYVAQQRGGSVMPTVLVPLGSRVTNALATYIAYIGKMLWPVHLAVFYPYRDTLPTVQWGIAAVVLVGITALVFVAIRRLRYPLVGWFWYLGTLVPVIGLVQVGQQAMADRYTYIPMIGLFIVVVWGLVDLAAGWRHGRVGLAALAAVVTSSCVVGTWFQVGYWKNGVKLFEHALKVTKGNALAHNNLGIALMMQRKPDEAILQYQEALRINPNDVKAHNNIGMALMRLRNPDEAIMHYQRALRVNPESAVAHINLGMALTAKGMPDQAITHYRKAMKINPRNPMPYNNLAWIRATYPDPRFRDGSEAVEMAEQACASPGTKEHILLDTLAAAYAEAGRFPEAVATAREALSLARSVGSMELLPGFERRLQGYLAGRPYRETRPHP